jgi:hypothetical protein
MGETKLTKAQQAKLGDVPPHLRRMYRDGVLGSTRDAVRFRCLECVSWLPAEVEACSSPSCVMYPYRATGVHRARTAAARTRALATGCRPPGKMPSDSPRESPDDPGNVSQPDPLPAEAVEP